MLKLQVQRLYPLIRQPMHNNVLPCGEWEVPKLAAENIIKSKCYFFMEIPPLFPGGSQESSGFIIKC